MGNLQLIFPHESLKNKAEKFCQEFFDAGEKTINGSYKLDMPQMGYEEWVALMRSNTLKESVDPKFGVSETYFAVNNDGEIIGIINFRHDLTPFYANTGHVGCSVRPSCRKKGYATEMVSLILQKAKAAGLQELKLVCRQSNVSSAKVIMKNGGVVVRTFGDKDDLKDEYVITLK